MLKGKIDVVIGIGQGLRVRLGRGGKVGVASRFDRLQFGKVLNAFGQKTQLIIDEYQLLQGEALGETVRNRFQPIIGGRKQFESRKTAQIRWETGRFQLVRIEVEPPQTSQLADGVWQRAQLVSAKGESLQIGP